MKKQLSRKKRGIIWGLIIVITLLLIISIIAYCYVQSMLNQVSRDESLATVHPDDEFFETDASDDSAEEINPEDVIWPDNNEEETVNDNSNKKNKNITNILLIGQDRRPGESRARSDSMMIATLNKDKKTIKITSLMRDMYVQIPGYSDNRINVSYVFGGMKLLDEVIEKNFQVHIDSNVEVDFEGFVEGIDIIGGVPITITKQEASHLRERGFSNLSAGKVNMDGELALEYARIRKIGNDHGRTERQRKVIIAAFEKVIGSSTQDLMELANKILPCVTTDMSNEQLISLGLSVFTSDLSSIEQHRIPLDGSYKDAWIRGMLVMVPDLDVNRQELKDIIYGE